MAAPPPRPTIGLNGTSTANVSGPMSSSADLAQPARPVSSQGGPSAPQTTALTEAQKEEQERLAEMKEKKKKEREELLMKKDKSMGELLLMLDDYQPLIPDEVTDYYLQRSGFECDDPRLKRLLSLAAQKFVNDIASDAFHYAKLRMNAPVKTSRSGKSTEKEKGKVVLTMDDLSNALSEHGVNAKKPDYYF